MRAVIAFALVACTSHYDPIAAIPDAQGSHRVFPDTASAIGEILAETEGDVPKVFAVGEYHDNLQATPHRAPLSRFTDDIIGLLVPRAHHLVIESWLDTACGDRVEKQVDAATGRDTAMAEDIHELVVASKRNHLVAHGLPISCIEQNAVLDGRGRVDFLLLLELVADKLADTTRELVAEDPGGAVIVYGGALHNDLYPPWPLEQLSYALPLQRELGGHVLEIDLVVPEVVAPMRMVRYEPWFPLLALASPSNVIVWKRAPDSYVVILPAQTEAVAAVAKPVY